MIFVPIDIDRSLPRRLEYKNEGITASYLASSVSQYHTVKYYILEPFQPTQFVTLLNIFITTFAPVSSHYTAIMDPEFENIVLLIDSVGPEDPLGPNAFGTYGSSTFIHARGTSDGPADESESAITETIQFQEMRRDGRAIQQMLSSPLGMSHSYKQLNPH
jgi:hypothetical protein